MDPPQSEEKIELPQHQLDRDAALAYACVNKVSGGRGMDLGNHRSAYRTLRKLDGKFKEALLRMGYGDQPISNIPRPRTST